MVKRKNFYWSSITRGTFNLLWKDNLSTSQFKIWFYLCSKADFNDNNANVRQTELVNKIGLDKSTVSRAINGLLDLQYIVKSDSGFMVNPKLIYTNKTREYDRDSIRSKFTEYLKKHGKKDQIFIDEDNGELTREKSIF